MVNSVLTNNGAMTALQSLKATQKNLLQTQDRISTGLRVGSAKDNAATWAVATSMRSDIANFKQVSENLSVSSSIVTTARSATEQMSDLMKEIRTKVTAAQNPAVDSRQLQADIDQLVGQMQGIVDAASYKGVNLINNEGNQRVLGSVNSVNGLSTPAYIDVATKNLSTTREGALGGLADVSVVKRGDALFNSATATAAEKAYATRLVSFNVTDDAAATGDELNSGASGAVTVAYTDKDGNARTLTTSTITTDASASTAELVSSLNADATFAKMFHASLSSTSGDLMISAANRGDETGSFKITGLSSAALFTTAAATETKRSTEMVFQDNQPLKMGERFTLNYKDGTTAKSVILEVGNGSTGDIISTNAGNTEQVIRIAYDDVKSPQVLGSTLASKFEAALDAVTISNFGTAATVADGTFQADATGSTLVIKTNDTTDDIVSFTPPVNDYKAVLQKVDDLATVVTNAAASFGSAGKRIELQKNFMDKLVDTLSAGVGALVDADMSEEAARLQALQVQEQLGTQALSIANQAPQSILSLFR